MLSGGLQIYESVYDLMCDSLHDFQANHIWIQFTKSHQLHKYVYLFRQNKIKNILLDTFGSKSYTESYADYNAKLHVWTAPSKAFYNIFAVQNTFSISQNLSI
jgi:hypothetical protein